MKDPRRRTTPIGLKNIHKTHRFKRHPDKIIIDKLEAEIKELKDIVIELIATDNTHEDKMKATRDFHELTKH